MTSMNSAQVKRLAELRQIVAEQRKSASPTTTLEERLQSYLRDVAEVLKPLVQQRHGHILKTMVESERSIALHMETPEGETYTLWVTINDSIQELWGALVPDAPGSKDRSHSWNLSSIRTLPANRIARFIENALY